MARSGMRQAIAATAVTCAVLSSQVVRGSVVQVFSAKRVVMLWECLE